MRDVPERADFTAVPETGTVVIGFSGGADSTALTHLAMQTIEKERIVCAHVNHMLRGREADRDEAAAAEFCRQHGLRFALLREDIKKRAEKERKSTEECGRDVRYAFFESLAQEENDRILTAHNADDNAETVLMNLAKGTGLSGLCGIPRRRGKILRPLLSVSRADIERYCVKQNLPFVTDSTNEEQEYTRNKLRHTVMPVLNGINPRFVSAVAQMTRGLQADADYIAQAARKLLSRAKDTYGLRTEPLKRAHPGVRTAALKDYFDEMGCGRLSRLHIEKAAESLENGSRIVLPGNMLAECSRGVLTLRPAEKPEKWEAEVREGVTALPGGKELILDEKIDFVTQYQGKINKMLFNSTFDCDTITGVLKARNRRDGDMFRPAGRNGTKSVRKLFREMDVPAANRDDMVLLTCADGIVFVEGAGVAERFRVTENTKRAALVRIEEMNGLGSEK